MRNMRKWISAIHNQSIRNRLITWFLIISLVPICWTTIFSYYITKQILLQQTEEHLERIVRRQEIIINNYFNAKMIDAQWFSRAPTILRAFETFKDILIHQNPNSVEYQYARLQYATILKEQIAALQYEDLWFVTKEGLVLFSLSSSHPVDQNILNSTEYAYLQKLIKNSLHSEKTLMTSLIMNDPKNSFVSFFSIPIFSREDQLIGLSIVKLNNTNMYKILAGFEFLGFANLMIATEIDNSLYVINPLQTDQGKTEEEINIKSNFGRFIHKALTQPNVIASDIDYKGHDNIIAGKHLTPDDNWALVTLIDQTKLLSPIYRLLYAFLILVPVTSLAVILVASQVAKKFASPILALTKKTNAFANGDLSQRISITSQDEIGHLGISFNIMASKLNNLINHLDEMVAQRTKEYEIQNVKLEQTIKELRQTRDQLVTQEKLASLGALTAGIAHEIKNPLNFIQNFAELNLELEQDIQLFFDKIKDSFSESERLEVEEKLHTLRFNIGKVIEHCKRADSIIFNMLQHSRGMPGEKSSINLHQLLDEYIALSYHGLRAQNTSFNVTLEKSYDPSISDISVVPQEFSRVILNLLSNAYYSVMKKQEQQPYPSYQPKVRISTSREPSHIVVRIWDNGLGISPEVFPKLFTPFFTTKPPREGNGLGLSISYNIIVQGHGGSLSASSKVGEYAEFKITLPDTP